MLSKLAFSIGSFGQHSLKTNQLSGRIATSPVEPALSLSKGTAESSPGRQSWVYIPTETSPAGTAETAPGRQSWVNLNR